MTTAAGSPAPRNPGLLRRLAMLVGHYYSGGWGIAACTVFYVAYSAIWWRVDMPAAFHTFTGALTWVLAVGLVGETMWHQRGLCLRCMSSSPLLDPQGAIDKHMSSLRFYHMPLGRKLAISWMGFTPIVLSLLTKQVAGLPIYAKLVLLVLALLGAFTTSYLMIITNRHRRLQPWCPLCRHDDGPDEPAVAPTPDPVGTAQR